MTCSTLSNLTWAIVALAGLGTGFPLLAFAQSETSDAVAADEDFPAAPEAVEVQPTAEDPQIAARLQRILEATQWFQDPSVRVEEGVVFLSGRVQNADHKQWATNLAQNTRDAVAVVNRIDVATPRLFDFTAARTELREMTRSAIQSAPTFAAAIVAFTLALLATYATSKLGRRVAANRTENPLLRSVVAKAMAIPVLILGAYVALRISGLTRLAATVLGGTGLLGIVIGIAFRDIAENFLASILISLQRPFRLGDLVTIDGRQGYAQQVTTRGTLLMTLDGNHVQIPNSTVYKSVIENATANPNVRLSFVVGVDYEDAAAEAQSKVLEAVQSHSAVLDKPEPLVLVEELAASTVNLRVYFWIDGHKHSVLRVRSAVLRRVKKALQQFGFTLPDESREIIFPHGVPVTMSELAPPTTTDKPVSNDGAAARERTVDSSSASSQKAAAKAEESDATTTEAEGGLETERNEIEQQARASRSLCNGASLVDSNVASPPMDGITTRL